MTTIPTITLPTIDERHRLAREAEALRADCIRDSVRRLFAALAHPGRLLPSPHWTHHRV